MAAATAVAQNAPYMRGRYTFTGFDAGLREYLLKWRMTKDQRSLRIIPAGQLMALSNSQWQEQVGALAAYDHYNSAALLTHWFLHYDGDGDGRIASPLPPACPANRIPLSFRSRRAMIAGHSENSALGMFHLPTSDE